MNQADAGLTAQIIASDPKACVFVEANAGSGKTSTLVNRVARLLLSGAQPETILCVTFTKAAATEMQARLFSTLGAWAVMDDGDLRDALERIEEGRQDLSKTRALFARALETPGGLKIQTLHAFCERLLRRFPLEAGLSPAFSVLDDAAAAGVSRQARDDLGRLALKGDSQLISDAYAHLSIEIDWRSFDNLLALFESRREDIAAYVAQCDGTVAADVSRRLGLEEPTAPDEIGTEALARTRWSAWRRAAETLAASPLTTDQKLAAKMSGCGPHSSFAEVWSVFSTGAGEPKKVLATQRVDQETRAWLTEEQARLERFERLRRAATIADNTVKVLILAQAYAALYEAEKARLGAVDYGDLVELSVKLLTQRADAAWVLFKLDGGIDHLLLDEAQDTSPPQWDILRSLTAEFFSGRGAGDLGRTVFAVGDEKQSIFSFQGAAPERLSLETRAFSLMAQAAGIRFEAVKLLESWRSTPEILEVVDAVFSGGAALAGIRPATGLNLERFPLQHRPRRPAGGRVDIWPLEEPQLTEEVDPWAPLDSEPVQGAGRRLAQRIADQIAHMVEAGYGVWDKDAGAWRPCAYGDVLILVRRRKGLFHEIIRALKRAGIPVGGADRLDLSEHGVFQDLLALGRFALFPADDLTLASLLRGPFCDVDETSLFELAHDRRETLWRTLQKRAKERDDWCDAAKRLQWVVETLPDGAPFDTLSRFLARLDEAGRSMRQRLLTRLGVEGEDALEAILSLVLTLESQGFRDLESLIAALAKSELQVKREPDSAEGPEGGEVRVMTTHGAKGLEAPIVILPDTTTKATGQGAALFDLEGGGVAWAPRSPEDCPASAAARDTRERAAILESSRLLYVAMTRARDWLIVAGVKTEPRSFRESWRDLIETGVAPLEWRATPLAGGGEGLRYGADPLVLARRDDRALVSPSAPSWAEGLVSSEDTSRPYVSPSSLLATDQAESFSPLATEGLGRYRRGELIHGLLQRLPDVAPTERLATARRSLSREPDLNEAQCEEMAAAALGVIENEAFAAVFGPGSRAEVAIVGAGSGLPDGMTISGRIDRLVVEAHRVLVIDFKTNRPAPDRIEDADPTYIAQMAAYCAVLAEVYPDRAIEAALVWTDGPRLMQISGDILQASLVSRVTKTS